MPDFRLKINGLRNIPYASAVQESLPLETSFELEYFFNGQGNLIIVKPILLGTVVVFLIHFPEPDRQSMALVYNKKENWSDIEQESTGLTEAIGVAIENYYSSRYLPWSLNQKENRVDISRDPHLLN
jgi:hypothetical protein